MGIFKIKKITQVFAWLIAAILVYLNTQLVYEEASAFLTQPGHGFWKIFVVAMLAGAMFLLSYIVLHPWLTKQQRKASIEVHKHPKVLEELEIPVYNHIAIALDFSEHDEKLLAHALGQGNPKTKYLLIHIVESASARMLGPQSNDYETRRDQETLDSYAVQLKQKGFEVNTRLGYKQRVKEIVRIVKEEQADILVVGAHGHRGLKDLLYGQTVNAVRHELKVPLLVVSI